MKNDKLGDLSEEDRRTHLEALKAIDHVLHLVSPGLGASILAQLLAHVLHTCIPEKHIEEALENVVLAIKDTLALLEESAKEKG